MLFLLAMEPLHMLFKKAQEIGLLHKISPVYDGTRASLYANDATVFIHPSASDLQVTYCILKLFADASGLATNMSKTHDYPIYCDNINLDFLSNADRIISHLPCTYLGLPLSTRKPSRAMIQVLIQKIGNHLPGWNRNFLTYPGRELLVKSVLSSMPTHLLIVFKMPRWAISGMDKFRRSFL
jgi:hypothetical protein